MATQGQGSSTELRIGSEATFGTDAIATEVVKFIPTLTLAQSQTQNQSAVMTGTRDMSAPFMGFTTAAANFSIPVDTDFVGFFFKKFLGTVDTTGAGPYEHVFTRHDTALESMTIEKAHLDLDTPTFHKGNGFKGNSFTINLGGESEVQMDLDFIGQKVTNGTAQLVAPTASSAGAFFQPFESSITGDLTSTNVKTASLTFTNNLDGNQQIIGNNGVVQSIPLGMIGVTGSITATYENDTLNTDAQGNITKSFIFTLTQGANILAFEMNEVKLTPFGVDVPQPEGLEFSFDFTAFFDVGANGSALAIKLTNSVVSY